MPNQRSAPVTAATREVAVVTADTDAVAEASSGLGQLVDRMR